MGRPPSKNWGSDPDAIFRGVLLSAKGHPAKIFLSRIAVSTPLVRRHSIHPITRALRDVAGLRHPTDELRGSSPRNYSVEVRVQWLLDDRHCSGTKHASAFMEETK